MGRGPSLGGIIYLILGLIIAASENYFKNVDDLEKLVEAFLAVILWPLVLLGIDMRF